MRFGICHCGCGTPAPLAIRTRPEHGYIKGRPVWFAHGHGRRLPDGKAEDGPNPSGLCMCGYETPCWVWNGARGPGGYGISGGGHSADSGYRTAVAHRKMYEQEVGPIPDGYVIDHICHDPATCKLGNACPHRGCVNPTHLRPVTRTANARRNGNTILNEEKVAEIRRLLAAGEMKRKDIAEKFGVSGAAITFIATRRTWR